MGYVGPVLVRHLRTHFPEAVLIGFDSGLFAHCLTACNDMPEALLDRWVFGDVRDIDASLLGGCDAVVHLAPFLIPTSRSGYWWKGRVNAFTFPSCLGRAADSAFARNSGLHRKKPDRS